MKNFSLINLKSKKWMLVSGLILLLLGFLVAASPWSEDPKFKSYSVGFSTPGDYVWVTSAKLDQRIEILGGSIQGAWEESGANNAVFDAPMPHEIYVSWIEQKTKVHYKATVKLVDDLGRRARELPLIRYNDPEMEESVKRVEGPGYNKVINLIIGMTSQGKVVIWLSNFPHRSSRITGYTIEIIGEAQGEIVPPIPPGAPSDKSNR